MKYFLASFTAAALLFFAFATPAQALRIQADRIAPLCPFPNDDTSAAQTYLQNKNIKRCSRNADCTLVTGACGGEEAVNRSSAYCYQEASRIYGRIINCVLLERPPQKAVCEQGFCTTKNK